MGGYVIGAPFGGACLADGFDALANALRCTLGPAGRTALVARQDPGAPPEAPDAAAVIARRVVELPAPRNTGAMLLRHLVLRVERRCGDGTATAAVVAQALLRACRRQIAAGAQPALLRRGIESALGPALASLERQAIVVTEVAVLRRVALAAGADDELAQTLADVYERHGADIVVVPQDWQANALHVEVADGAKWDSGFASPSFVNDPARGLAWSENPRLLFTTDAVARAAQLLPVMERVAAAGERALVVIAPAISGSALAALLVNNERGAVRSVGVLAPGLGDHRVGVLTDLAALTGGRVRSERSGGTVESTPLADLGRCRLVWASRDFFSVIDGAGPAALVVARARDVAAALEREEAPQERELLRLRLGRLRGGVVTLGVGAATKATMLARRERAERAVRAVEAARREGVVPGGGASLLACAAAIAIGADGSRDERLGAQALACALEAPARTILENAGVEAGPVLRALRYADAGAAYDVVARRLVNAWDAGILDPHGVTRTALTCAVSAAIMAMLTDTVVVPRHVQANLQSGG